MSIKELADKSGISKSYICELEKFKKNPSQNTLQKIADALDVCPKDLISCKENCKDCKKRKRKTYPSS